MNMHWTYRSGDRVLELSSFTRGLGLMEFPSVSHDIAGSSYVNPRGDGRRMGIDTIPGQVVSLLIEARPDHRALDAVWREFLGAWRADAVRRVGGAMASLTSHTGRTAYGRPRALSPNQEHRLSDLVRAEVAFECVDDLWYGPPSTLSMRFAPVNTGGLAVPIEVPLIFDGGEGVADQLLEVDGDVETWGVYTLHGPIADPWIDVPGVGVLRFNISLPYDGVLTVDTRPWARWVKRDGHAAPGALVASGARLSDMALSPGSYRVIFGGYDPSGTSRLDVSVEPAFTSF